MGLISFPIMALPLLEEAAGLDMKTLESKEWQAHVSQFLKANLALPK